MPDLDRIVAGTSCRDVLARLSDFLDGLLGPEDVAQVHAHLAGCSTCAQFGADMTQVLSSLRAGGADVSPALEDDALARLRDRIKAAIAPS